MSRATYYDTDDIVRWYRGLIQKIEKVPSEMVAETVEAGAERMRELILERNTDTPFGRGETPWAGKYKTHPGRIDSGRMIEAVESRVTIDTANRTQGHFGWLSDREPYFQFQEGGFDHWRTGEQVEGMYALADAAEEVFDDFKRNTRKRLNDVQP